MLFNNNDWKLSVTDINLYENTVSLYGQSHQSLREYCESGRSVLSAVSGD